MKRKSSNACAVGGMIRRWREKAGLSIEQLEAASKVSRLRIAKFETSVALPQRDELAAIGKALNRDRSTIIFANQLIDKAMARSGAPREFQPYSWIEDRATLDAFLKLQEEELGHPCSEGALRSGAYDADIRSLHAWPGGIAMMMDRFGSKVAA